MKALLLILLGTVLPAQIVHLTNESAAPFDGYVRTTVDVMPPHRAGVVKHGDGGRVSYMLGRQVGRETRALDLRLTLAAGKSITLDLGKSQPADFSRDSLPADQAAWFGGQCTLGAAGEVLRQVSLQPDGAGYQVHLRGRTGRMLVSDIWLHWIPSQSWARGEILTIASNPDVPDMGESIPADFALGFGDAIVFAPGRRPNGPLLDAGEWLADGQGRALPLVLWWPRRLQDKREWQSVQAEVTFAVSAVGIRRLLPQGNPRYPSDFDAASWTKGKLSESIARLSDWRPGVVGPNANSSDTGAQEDQTFVRGEPLAHPPAVWICYLGALKLAARPCHHREQNGEQVDPLNHPRLVYWDSRCHIPGVSPDQLGKPRGLSPDESHRWWGADVEHTLFNTLAAACRYTGSPACQALLEAQARVYLTQWTVDPALPYQSQPFAARATCWEGLLVQHCWENLEDRDLARRVFERGSERVAKVIVPAYRDVAGGVWDWRRDDRIGPGQRWMPWQQAAGSYGLDLLAELVGSKDGRQVALEAAKAVLRDAWWRDGEGWTCRDVVAADGAPVPSGAYDYFGSPLAIAVILRHAPEHELARSIWQQLLSEARDMNAYRWLAPGVK